MKIDFKFKRFIKVDVLVLSSVTQAIRTSLILIHNRLLGRVKSIVPFIAAIYPINLCTVINHFVFQFLHLKIVNIFGVVRESEVRT